MDAGAYVKAYSDFIKGVIVIAAVAVVFAGSCGVMVGHCDSWPSISVKWKDNK